MTIQLNTLGKTCRNMPTRPLINAIAQAKCPPTKAPIAPTEAPTKAPGARNLTAPMCPANYDYA